MSEAWLNFGVIILFQMFLFIACALFVKRLPDAPSVLVRGILTGIVFGLLFDLIVGKLLGLHSYVLGFTPLFLIINATLSYGLFASTILLLQRARLVPFYIWTLAIIATYEIANLFFRVWLWEFAVPFPIFLIVLFVGYSGGAILIAVAWHLLLGYRFSFISNIPRTK